MARDRDLLSDKEFFRKTSDIAEHMRDCEIDIVYWDDDNKVIDKDLNGKKFVLNVASPAVKGIEKFTAFNHELGHIIMDTPIGDAKKLVDKWCVDDEDKLRQRTYWNVMNVLEDQRIESLMAKLWLANEKRFIKARTNRGKLHKECTANPVDILLNIRFFREDLACEHNHFDEYKQALEDIHVLGRLGALIILKKLKPIIDEWVDNDKIEHEQHVKEPLDGSDLEQLKHNQIKDDTEFIDKLKDDDDIDDAIKESKEEGKQEINDLRDMMNDGYKNVVIKPTYLKTVERQKNYYEIDKHVSHNLRRVFRNISEIPKNTIGYDGNEIDVESYIEGKIRGYDINNCFVDKKITHGLSIVMSIDGSMSMKTNDKMNKVRNLVATLFDSIKDYQNIELKANVWSSNNKGEMGVTDINNIEDCAMISAECLDRSFCLTPTHLALDYASRTMKRMKGRKKLLILITDGQPQYQNWGYNISSKTLLKMNKKASLKARRQANEMVVLSVGVDVWGGRILEEVFGKNKIIHVRNMGDGGVVVANRFKNAVLDTLK
jgi:hypothetical protein